MREFGDDGPAEAMHGDDIGNGHGVAHQKWRVAKPCFEPFKAGFIFPFQAFLHRRDAFVFGQDETMASGCPKQTVHFIEDKLGVAVLEGAFNAARRMGKGGVFVAQIGQDCGRIGQGGAAVEKDRDLARRVMRLDRFDRNPDLSVRQTRRPYPSCGQH